MPQAISIDNFLEAHNGNQEIELCGKLGIVRAILQAEKNCSLNFDQSNTYNKLDFSKLEKTWLIPLQQLLFQNIHLSQIENVFSNIAFIVFNYDRCIEQFLFLALQNYYGINEDQASKIVQKLVIFHPYGTVGKLPWQQKSNPIPFGKQIHHSELLNLSDQIKTFNERVEDKEFLEKIRNVLFQANYIFFLGFAYHQQNLDLISSPDGGGAEMIIGTGYGLSQNDCKIISNSLRGITKTSPKSEHLQIKSGLTCKGFFTENWRLLSLI